MRCKKRLSSGECSDQRKRVRRADPSEAMSGLPREVLQRIGSFVPRPEFGDECNGLIVSARMSSYKIYGPGDPKDRILGTVSVAPDGSGAKAHWSVVKSEPLFVQQSTCRINSQGLLQSSISPAEYAFVTAMLLINLSFPSWMKQYSGNSMTRWFSPRYPQQPIGFCETYLERQEPGSLHFRVAFQDHYYVTTIPDSLMLNWYPARSIKNIRLDWNKGSWAGRRSLQKSDVLSSLRGKVELVPIALWNTQTEDFNAKTEVSLMSILARVNLQFVGISTVSVAHGAA